VATNIEVWADYAKDRFESAAKRVDEFRNWARQLSAAVAVVIGLELTLVGMNASTPSAFSSAAESASPRLFSPSRCCSSSSQWSRGPSWPRGLYFESR
jgi:hypothetical protein